MNDKDTVYKELRIETGGAEDAVLGMVESLAGVQEALDQIVEKMGAFVVLMTPQTDNVFNNLMDGVDGFNKLADGRSNVEDIFEAINEGLEKCEGEDFSIFKALIPETEELTTTLCEKTKELAGVFDTSAAAMWLQNAATTAWNGVSSVAATVTAAFGAAVNFLTSPIGLVVVAVAALIAIIAVLVANWDTVKAGLVAGWEAVKTAFGAAVEWIGGVVQSGIGVVQRVFQSVDDFLQNVFAVSWSEKFGFFGGVLDAFFANVENIWNAVKTVFQGVVQFVSSVFAGDWKGAWDGIVTIFTGIWDGIVAYLKIPINAAIGVLNGFLNHVEAIVNAVIGLLNGISVEVPDREIFGDLAGKAFGFQLAPVALPRIPLLAKGAVLPANRPFLAMVGDQRQGTNVEAPLATIQEAVALVMGDQVAAMMAGFREVVREQQALRAAVEGIEVGDEVIGRAAVRYGERMAVVKGS
ncbi:MAG: hypothetical protein IIV61_09610 [Oscillospiraceae bacterium]|nr:hypothetical protein [Oscillospiraceae bacterium]